MAEKILNTRIQLKHDTLANWQSKNTLLKKGEIAIAVIEAVDPANKLHQPVMFKVGPGNFNDLEWASALAADVYAWAKKPSLDPNDLPEIPGLKLGISFEIVGEGNAITNVDYDTTNKKFTFTKGETFATKKELEDVVANGTVVAEGAKIDVAQNGNTYTVSHEAIAQAEAGKTVAARTYVTGVTTDGYGHITGYTTATESDQDLSGYKTKQTAVDEKGAADKTLKISQDTNGVITVTPIDIAITASQVTDFATEVAKIEVESAKNADVAGTAATASHADAAAKVDHALTIGTQTFDGSAAVTVTAADLGLESAMHFVGALSAAPADAKAGDVYLNTATHKEYVYDETQGWVELGDEGSYALRTVTITANEGLTGGGDLTADRTIGIANSGVTTAKIADANVTKAKLAADIQTTLDKADSALQAADIVGKADKVTGATADNFAGLDANGNLTDSGKKAADFATAEQGTKAEHAYGMAAGAEANANEALTRLANKMDKFGTVDSDGSVITNNSSFNLYISNKQAYLNLDSAGAALVTPGQLVLSAGEYGVSVSNRRIASVGTPTDDTDAANKKYVDDAVDAVDTGVMSITANDTDEKASGIKIDNTDAANPKIELDDTITWVFDCGGAE